MNLSLFYANATFENNLLSLFLCTRIMKNNTQNFKQKYTFNAYDKFWPAHL
jgi:hypothetical protein